MFINKVFNFFENLNPPFPKEDPPKPPKTLMAFIYYYTKDFKKPLILMSLLAAIIGILEASLFGLMGDLVDWLQKKNPETLFSEEWKTIALFSILILIVIPFTKLIHSLIIHQGLLGNYPMTIRWNAHRYLLGQSISFYQNDFAGRISTKVMQTALSVRETVLKTLNLFVYIIVYLSSMIVIIAKSEIYLVIPVIIWLIFYILIQSYFIPKLKRVSKKQANARSIMTGRVVDSYTNILTVKLFSHTTKETEYAKKSMKNFLKTVYPQMRLVTGIKMSIEFINYLLIFSIGFLSIFLWSKHLVTLGGITIAISLTLKLSSMSQWIMWELSAVFEHIGTVIDGMNTLSKPITIEDKKNSKNIKIKKGEITFKNLDFSYEGQKEIIKNFNLKIKKGEKIGLVGRSGAGKSTLINLLLRFYEVSSGEILIDNVNIKNMTQDSLRQNIAVVTQDTSLLHRSIRENILYGKPEATEEEMIKATKKAEAHEFIKTLKDLKGKVGYSAEVGERGVKLSGGQRQRILIARVLLKDAPILILDEATSALDSEVESEIQKSLYKLMKGKTVIAIAHRLSTIAKMDRLIVIDNGKIVEEGAHNELIKNNKIYNHLWTHQIGGFLQE